MLKQSQRERLQSIHAYEWVTESEAESIAHLERLYSEIETVDELWFASFIIPLNPERGDLFLVLDHPLCDRGIASFLYWSLDPAKLYADNELNRTFSPILEVLRNIETRLLTGYYQSAAVCFSPTMLDRHLNHDRIPRELLTPTEGVPLPLDYQDALFAPTQ